MRITLPWKHRYLYNFLLLRCMDLAFHTPVPSDTKNIYCDPLVWIFSWHGNGNVTTKTLIFKDILTWDFVTTSLRLLGIHAMTHKHIEIPLCCHGNKSCHGIKVCMLTSHNNMYSSCSKGYQMPSQYTFKKQSY